MLAAAADHPGIVERFDLRPVGTARPSRLRALAEEPRGVLLFSHYTWSTRGNLLQSAAAKAANDRFITVHGGPNVPGFPEDVERFLGENPHVDVLVHGEGEATFVDLMSRIGETGLHDRADPDRLALLGDIPGLTVRVGDRIVRGPKRPRISDLDATPSAYLAGQFDQVALAGSMAVIETNRGCPFGCTFCDWGSATRSRVRTFGLDRVRAEVRWLAERGVDGIFVADANFGAFERDLEIARAIADAKRAHGAPRQVMFTFAKDTAELLIPIVDLLWDVGIDVDGNLALQTVDEPTLRIVRRKNLPEPEYRRVRAQFRERGLPLTSDIMLGLPGSTYESMRADVQFCLDHEITPRAHRTVLLPNAPMRSPQHREEHAIVTDHLQRTVAGSTFTAEELKQVGNLHRLADAWDHYGIARLPLRWASRDHGIAEVEILERVDRLTRDEPSRYPAITWSAVGFTSWLVPPGTWEAFLGELRVWLVEALGVPDDDALASVLAAQAAVLPCPGASFPRRVELAHDVAAWLAQHAEAPGDRDQRRLLEFPPTVLEVDDDGANDALLVANRQSRAHTGRALREVRRIYGPSWELRSPLARAQMLSVEEHAFRFAE
ncbi:MAG: radical SAM protein [Acidimicrobiales bacterium]